MFHRATLMFTFVWGLRALSPLPLLNLGSRDKALRLCVSVLKQGLWECVWETAWAGAVGLSPHTLAFRLFWILQSKWGAFASNHRLKEKPWNSPLSRYRVLSSLSSLRTPAAALVLSIMLCDLGELSPWPSFTPCLSSHLSTLNTSLFQPLSEPKLWQKRACLCPVSPVRVYPPLSPVLLSRWQVYVIIVSRLGNEGLFFPSCIQFSFTHSHFWFWMLPMDSGR